MPIYQVFLSGDTVSEVGAHPFAEPLIPGREVTFNEEQWFIEDVAEDTSPPQVTLKRA